MSTTNTTSVRRGLIFVTIAAIAWGTGGVVAAILYRTSGLGPFAVSFWRTVGGVALLALVYRLRRPAPRAAGTRARRWGIALATGLGLAVYQTAYYGAVQQSGVAFATVLTLGVAPVLVAIGARLAIGERLGSVGVLAVAVAPVGLLLIAGGGGGSLWGAVLSLVSASGYAMVTVLHRALGGVDPSRTTLAGFTVAGVLLAPAAAIEGLWPTRGDTGETLALLAYLGVISTAVAYSLFFASLGSVRATTVSIVTLSEPLTAAAIAVALLGEHLNASMLVGAAVLLGSVVLVSRAESRPPTLPAPA